MTWSNWSAHYVSRPPHETDEDRLAMKLVLAYHVVTERYDRQLPGCKGRGDEWLPAQGEPMRMSQQFSKRCYEAMMRASRGYVSASALAFAERCVSEMTCKMREEMLKSYGVFVGI